MSSLPLHSNQQKEGTFTCISCQIRFPSPEMQRIHMKTEWHRYNLKRRVAALAPIASHVFQLKIANKKESQNEDELGFYVHNKKKQSGARQLTKKDLKKLSKARGRKLGTTDNVNQIDRSLSPATSVASRSSTFSLGTVQSDFGSSNYDTDDLISELSKSDYDEMVSSSDDDEDENDNKAEELRDHRVHEHTELPLTSCFYCGADNSEVELNIRHMFSKHGLYIPERSYLINVEGLLKHIAGTISIDNECLKCGFAGKGLISIRQHLISKGHCVIPYETKEDREAIREFYNFNIGMECKSKHAKKSVSFAVSEDTVEEDHAQISVDEDESDYDDSEYTTAIIDNSGVELQLPNGMKLGHRKMSRYYKQSFPKEAREVDDGEKTISLIYPQSTELEAVRQKLRIQELKEKGVVDVRSRNKDIALSLKKGNNFHHFRDATF